MKASEKRKAHIIAFFGGWERTTEGMTVADAYRLYLEHAEEHLEGAAPYRKAHFSKALRSMGTPRTADHRWKLLLRPVSRPDPRGQDGPAPGLAAKPPEPDPRPRRATPARPPSPERGAWQFVARLKASKTPTSRRDLYCAYLLFCQRAGCEALHSRILEHLCERRGIRRHTLMDGQVLGWFAG